MDLHTIQEDLREVLTSGKLSQEEFATKHGLSYSWINKFLNGKAENPRLNSLNELISALEKERAQPA